MVSQLAFGTMTFTAGNREIGAIYKVDTNFADVMVGRALDRGVTFFGSYTPLEETLSALDVLVRAGKVRYFGFSN